MHIGRHIVQQLVLQFGAPAMERWSIPVTEEEFSEVERHRARGRAHDVTLLIEKGDDLVVVRKRHYPADAYCVPSGGIHPEEPFLEGAVREAREETGLDVEIQGYPLFVMVTFTCGGRSANWATHVFTAKPVSSELAPVNVTEIEAARWIGWETLLNEVNKVLRDSGLGRLAYRARIQEKAYELRAAARMQGEVQK